MSDFTRRLPVYLLLDCSGSMSGEPIEAVRQGVKMLLSELRGDPQALETAYLSIITFASSAQQISPLTELMLVKEPTINAGGATALGGALRVLMDCVQKEVRQSTETQKGDWRPLVFILTDGEPTDTAEFEAMLPQIKQAKLGNIIACAAGSRANTAHLKRITDSVLMMNSLSADDMAKFFAWVSGSVKMSSKSVDAKPGAPIELPPPPQGFVIVP
ncbi:MAG: VWA domain-containing protein [Ruminococcus sp.]|nr:VWA domain-containing protein [Ruminococcus sp.]MBQ8904828.1 VWA domain-containing protein [Ruminococcus sp.]